MKINFILFFCQILIEYIVCQNKQNIGHVCQHDQLIPPQFTQEDIERIQRKSSKRLLQNVKPQPFRVTYDVSQLSNSSNGSGMTDQKKNDIIKILDAAVIYLNKLIKVIPRDKPLKSPSSQTYCGSSGFILYYSDDLKNTGSGIPNSDLHLLITYENNEYSGTIASAGICEFDPNPIIGRMRFNIAYINSDQGHISFQDNFKIVLHEITHILGFSKYAIQFWRNPQTGKTYDQNQIYEYDYKKDAYKVKTYNIAKVAQIHFNCNSIDGMYFENQGGAGTMGSHWERDLVLNEYMTGSRFSYIAVVSEFTAALLRDTGFYAEVNSNYVGEIKQGQNQGCDFFNKSCSSSTKYDEFGTTSDLNKNQCVQYGIGYGVFTQSDFLSQCISTRVYENGFCEDTLNSSNSDIQYRQSYGSGSKCFNSNVFQNGFSSDLKNYRCLKYKCSTDFKTIDIYFWKDEYVTCKTPLEVIEVQQFSSTSYGPVECPANFRQFCTYPKFCKNFCSSNGICTNGICVCLNGFAGEDCSIQCASPNVYDGVNCIQKCSIDTFKNPDNTCKTTCPFGYFKDSSINECIICHRFCSSCTGPTSNECQSCNIGYTVQGNSCVISCHSNCTTCFGFGPNNCLSCPETKYLDSYNSCQSCISNCKTCTNDSSCLECQPLNSLEQNQKKCISLCHSSCKTCIKPNDNTQCSSCFDGYYLSGTSCFACTSPCQSCSGSSTSCKSCIENYVYNFLTDSCSPICHSSCKTCIKPKDSTQCSQCIDGYYLSDNSCLVCDSPCKQCSGSSTSCRSCIDNYVFDNSTNICTKCLDGYYALGNSCFTCASPCKTCSGSSTTCTTCIENYQYKFLTDTCSPICHSSCKTCIKPNDRSQCSSCVYGYYLSGTSCLACTSPCQSCSGSSTSCRSCIENYQYNFLTDTCVSICHSSCQTCIKPKDITQCSSCIDGYYLSGNSCLACDSSCKSCSGSSTSCRSCFENYVYNNSTNICIKCQQPCLTCKLNDSTQCTSCIEGYFLQGTLCLPCSSPCKTCQSSSTQCKSCIENYVYNSLTNACNKCLEGQYISDNTCLACASPCKSCQGYSTSCRSCIDKYQYNDLYNFCYPKCQDSCKLCSFFDSSKCYDCSDGFYLSGTSCLPCDSPCKSCSGSSTSCRSCIENYQYNFLTDTCSPICHSFCETCIIQNDQTQCSSCIEGYYLSGNSCLVCDSPCKSCLGSSTSCRSCIDSYQYDFQAYSCSPICHESCKTCSNPNECSSCVEGYYLSSYSCLACASPCKTCSGYSTSCRSCITNYEYQDEFHFCSPKCHESCKFCSEPLDSTKCQYQCSDGFYLSRTSCLACTSPCKQCSNSSTQCTECIEGYIFNHETYQCNIECHTSCQTCIYNNNEFCTSCNIGYYLDMSDSVWKCIQCSSSCKSCVTQLICDTCQDGYELDERGICKPICDQSCETCSSPHDKNACLSCLSPLILKDQQCLNQFCHQTCKDCIGNEYSSCISCFDSRELVKISDDYGTCECLSDTSDFNEQICEQSSTQEQIKTTTTAFFATSVVSLSILSIVSVNPVLMLSFLEFSQSVSHLRYINQRQPLGFDQVAGIIAYSHFSEFSAQSMDNQDFKRILNQREQNEQKMQVIQKNVKLKLSNKTHDFITNAYLILTIQTLSWILSFLSIFLERKYTQNIFKYLKKMFKISFPIVIFVVCSQEMWLLIFYQLQTINFDSTLYQMSTIFCLISLLYMALFLGYLFYQLEYKKCIKYDEKSTLKSQKYQISENTQNIQNQELIKNLEIFYIISKYVKQNSFMTRNIVQIIILHKLIISCANVYITQNPIIQINVIIICNVIMIFYVGCFKPLKTIKGTMLLIIIYILETLIAFLYSLTIYLQNELPASKYIPLSIIVLIVIIFAIFSSYSYFIILKKIFQIVIQKNQKKIQNNPQIINSQQQLQQQQQQQQKMSVQVIQNQNNNNNSDQIKNQALQQQTYMSFQKNYNHNYNSKQTRSLKLQQEQSQQKQNNISIERNQNENSNNNQIWNIFLQKQKPNENNQNPYCDSSNFNYLSQKEQLQQFKLKQQAQIQNDQNTNHNIQQINNQQEEEQQISLIKIESEESIN